MDISTAKAIRGLVVIINDHTKAAEIEMTEDRAKTTNITIQAKSINTEIKIEFTMKKIKSTIILKKKNEPV
jgi:hypothetical protein